MLPHSSELSLQNSELSFVKNKWISLRSCLQIEKPLSSPSISAFLTSSCSPLVHRRKRKGENRSPCLIPLDGWIRLWDSPFTEIREEVARLSVWKCDFLISLKHISREAFSHELLAKRPLNQFLKKNTKMHFEQKLKERKNKITFKNI